MKYLYRVRVIKYPEGSEEYGWAPEGWVPDWEWNGDPNAPEPVFSWPHQRHYLSRSNAVRRAELFRKYGAEVVVERSDPITWPGVVMRDGDAPKPCCEVSPMLPICHCHTHWHPHRRSEECERLAERNRCIDGLIEASSLGTEAAKAIRDSVDDESVQRILDRVNRERGLA